MTEILQTTRDMPLAAIVSVAVLVLAGLVLWVAGRRVMRPGFVVLAVLAGGMIGFLLSVAGAPGFSPWIAACVGAIVAAIVAALAYRVAAAIALGAVFFIAAPLGVITVHELHEQFGPQKPAVDEDSIEVSDSISGWIAEHDETLDQARAALESANGAIREKIDEVADETGQREAVNDHLDQLTSFADQLAGSIREAWARTPKQMRPILMLAAIVGGLCGIVLGLLARGFAESAVTAMGGSFLWLAGAQILLTKLEAPEGPWLPNSGMAWLALWLITSAIGLAIQWKFRPRREASR